MDNNLLNHFDDEHNRECCIDFLRDIIVQCNAETREHIWYVGNYTRILAEVYAKLFPRSRMTARKQSIIVQAANIHDIGKIAIPDSILVKKGRMSRFEYELMKKHTIKGSQIIKSMSWNMDRDFERICYNVCLYHHEKHDGSGYPYGMRDNRIPVEAQLVGLADMYDALIHCSDNREVCTKDRAYIMLMNNKCGELSPKMRECLEEARYALAELEYVS